MGALSPTRRVGGPAENRIIFGSVRNRGKSCRLSDANSMTHVRARTPAEIRHLATRAAFPQRRSSKANTLCGQNSAGFLQICKTFKGIICDDISEFESFSIGAGWCQALSDCSVDPRFDITRRVLASLRDRHLGPPMMGIRRMRRTNLQRHPCRKTYGRHQDSKRTRLIHRPCGDIAPSVGGIQFSPVAIVHDSL
jgi:hypothetical protein